MYKYLHKYLKYKSKYFNIIYGGVGTPQASPSTPAPSTPAHLILNTPLSVSSASSTTAAPSTPKLVINPVSLTRLIDNKDELVCLLSACSNLSNYNITARPRIKDTNSQLYINFERKKKGFAHFSFHFPDDKQDFIKDDKPKIKQDDIRIEDIFEANTFHLKLDINKLIVFNLILDNDNYKLISKLDDCEIMLKIGEEDFKNVKEIITCFETILNSNKYKRILDEPTARKLFDGL